MDNYRVTLLPGNQTFTTAPGDIILDAAIAQGIQVAYSCRSGTCRTCIFKVVEGDVVMEDMESCLISPQEIDDGLRLLCMSRLKSNAVFEKLSRRRKDTPV